MKIKHITKPNNKGQIVIPKEIREELDIDPSVPLNMSIKGDSIHIHPIREVITESEQEDSYLDILERTKGSWDESSWEQTRTKRRKTELKASKQRKNQW
ncbi:MAG: AbrB/MazE/SpoVT family DNA-binding domain-containing protein [Candidatus Paceibacteria bacterium]